jgi:hypothetical protein
LPNPSDCLGAARSLLRRHCFRTPSPLSLLLLPLSFGL